MSRLPVTEKRIRVNFFQRRPHRGFSFSIEQIFEDIRTRLSHKIEARVYLSKYYNSGYLSKFANIAEAALRQGKDVNHITGEVHFLDLLMKKNRVVLTVHDCGMVHRKKGIAQKIITWLYLTAPVNKARFVTANSETTKNEVIRYTNCSPDKITVVPVAVDERYQPCPRPFNTQKPVLLHIGTGYNKNLERLIEALAGINCCLSIVGRLSEDQLRLLKANGIDYRNEYNISNDRLYQQYQECDMLIFVSTFEGFGMPIIEANSVERPVVTSNISSMPEVAGAAACLVDPYNISDIQNGILQVIQDTSYRETLLRNGRINKLRFNAATIADKYYAIYKKVVDA